MKILDAEQVRYLVVHTAAFNGDCSAAEIRRWHLERGWSDIGYHFVIRYDGTVELGRNVLYQGAHVAGLNHASIGICCSGNGDVRAFYHEQEAALLALCVTLARTYGVGPSGLIGHREVNTLIGDGLVPSQYATTKSCPGRRVSLARLRVKFAHLLHPPPEPFAIDLAA